ncbi:MAG: hypothetical protein H3C43_03310 [Leptonema sp. (in: Bacteria)]|nr:hypothetical protein [Leptonema sp. (in: bacteria)]
MDLREFYITPTFLKVMANRAKSWSSKFIQDQIDQFQVTIPDYPEVVELLEAELHRRSLNQLKQKLKNQTIQQLKQTVINLQKQYNDGQVSQDELEVAETEWRVRKRMKLPEDYKPGV